MKDSLQNTIIEGIGKLDTSTFLLIVPVLIMAYLVFYVSDEEIDKWLGNPVEQKIEVTCPHCGETFIYTIPAKNDE